MAIKVFTDMIDRVQLRPIELGDLPLMFEMQQDPEANVKAGTIPRTREQFDAHWEKVLENPKVNAKAILYDGVYVGTISCFEIEAQEHVGYWIDRKYWGKGIGSQALRLLLKEIPQRPLIATAATDNTASLRILQKCGFVVEEIKNEPASERYLEREVAVHVLR